MSQTYTVKQVAGILGYSTNSIYAFLKEKRIKGVRVGRGRFRIHQEELNRILHLSKNTPVASAITSTQTETNGQSSPLPYEGKPSLFNHVYVTRFQIPSLFDWFLGISSILLGVSMLLFSKLIENIEIQQFLILLGPLQVSFIAGGLGILISDIITEIPHFWHRIFHLILIIAYALFAFIRWQIGDGDGSLLFGLISLAILFNSFSELGGTLTLGLFVFFYSLTVPLTIIFNAPIAIYPNTGFFAQNSFVIGIVLLVLITIVDLFIWWSYRSSKPLFLPLVVLVGSFLIAFSLLYANSLAWQKSIVFLVLGLTFLFIPNWEQIPLWGRRGRQIIFALFGCMLITLLGALGVLWIIQANIIEYSRLELIQKNDFGKHLVESTLDSVQSNLSKSTQNKLLIEAVKDKDKERITQLLKINYEGNQNLRRLLVLDATGELLALYPLASLSVQNFAFREYFQKTLATKEPYMSDSFESKAKEPDFVTVITAPFLDADNTVIGVLVGSLDLISLQNKLQEITIPESKSYFILTNKKGQIIIHPKRKSLGKVAENDLIIKALNGQYGSGISYDYQGNRTNRAFDILENTGWTIELHVPIKNILRLTRVVSIALFSLITLLTSGVGIFLFLNRGRKTLTENHLLAYPKNLEDTS